MGLVNEKEDPNHSDTPSSSDEVIANNISYTPAEERALLRKVDLNLLPILTFIYLLSFLDRSNVGNAKLEGLLVDLKITDPSAYNTGLALYFLGYTLFEVPANSVLKRTSPKFWLSTLCVTWGIVATLQGLVKSQSGFYAARFFLGVAECGLFPGIVFVFSMYYKRRERHWRVAFMFGGAALSGAFGGVLAFGISKMHGIGGQPGWAWIFYLEGIFTVLAGILGYFLIPSYPIDAKFLNDREREILLARLKADGDAADDEPFTWAGVRAAYSDHLVWAYGLLFHGMAFLLYTLALFLPTIIAGLGYKSWQAQLLTVPPFAAAYCMMMFVAWRSHVDNRRAMWIILMASFAIIGYLVLILTHTPGQRYVGCFFAVMGVYAANALILSWPGENVSPQTKRATATANQIFVGNIGSITGVLIYRPSLNGHFFRTPHIIAIIYALFAIAVASWLWFWMARENKRRDALDAQAAQAVPKLNEKGNPLGDRHPTYRFII